MKRIINPIEEDLNYLIEIFNNEVKKSMKEDSKEVVIVWGGSNKAINIFLERIVDMGMEYDFPFRFEDEPKVVEIKW